MGNFYKILKVNLYTSRSEAFPLSFFECILAKIPIIASKHTLPLNNNIINESNIELDKNYVSVDMFDKYLMYLNNLPNQNVNITKLNKYITNNYNKIVNIINSKHTNNKHLLDLPIEYKYYEKLDIYQKFEKYSLNKDLLLNKIKGFDDNLTHFMRTGLIEEEIYIVFLF